MKKRFFYTWALLLFALNLKAQDCTPDISIINAYLAGELDVFPKPDTTLGDFPLNSGCVGEAYTTTFSFSVPYILASQGPNIDPLITRIDYWKIDSITGLPPGTMYVCEPDNCIFEDTTGCVSITGQPTVAGTFFPIIHTMVRAPTVLGTVSIPVNLPTLPSDIGGFEGAYQIDICSDKMCGSCIVGVNDTPKRTLNIQQNSPNPFWRNTNIIIHSKESDTFDFHVVNMMGKIIHNEQVYLFLGENNILFNGSKFPSGMYFYSIGKNGNYTFKKMMISGKK